MHTLFLVLIKKPPAKDGGEMTRRSLEMIAPHISIQDDPPTLLGDVRFLLSRSPKLKDYSHRLAALLNADEQAVEMALNALREADEAAA